MVKNAHPSLVEIPIRRSTRGAAKLTGVISASEPERRTQKLKAFVPEKSASKRAFALKITREQEIRRHESSEVAPTASFKRIGGTLVSCTRLTFASDKEVKFFYRVLLP